MIEVSRIQIWYEYAEYDLIFLMSKWLKVCLWCCITCVTWLCHNNNNSSNTRAAADPCPHLLPVCCALCTAPLLLTIARSVPVITVITVITQPVSVCFQWPVASPGLASLHKPQAAPGLGTFPRPGLSYYGHTSPGILMGRPDIEYWYLSLWADVITCIKKDCGTLCFR